jgi:hypothetical protein
MARSPDMTELLDIEKPGLTEWKDDQDAPLDAARASQLDLVDRSKLEELKDLLDAEYPDEKLFHNFMRDASSARCSPRSTTTPPAITSGRRRTARASRRTRT